MTGQDEFLKKLIDVLSDCSISYMVCGSLGSSVHGHPRATKDVDIVISANEEQLLKFAQSLGEGYYISLEAVREAFASKSMFNIIDSHSGWKADFILCKDRPYSRQEFERRRIAKIKRTDVWVTSAEDAILSKLEWARDSHSEQQFRDAMGVAVVQWDSLDVDYLLKWAKELQVEESLDQLMEQARKLIQGQQNTTFE